MNDLKMSLHWLRKDLRHHRVWLLVWVGLVMVFTAVRLYFRLGPVEIGYRNYLSVSLEINGLLSAFAAALALGELGLILRILRDDPARGSHAFWKTRPPSGNVMFSAKAMAVLLVAMLPLIGEWIFLKVAGFSGGTRERIFCYLLPLVVGLAGGVACGSWKTGFPWMVFASLFFLAGVMFFALLGGSQEFPGTGDLRLTGLAGLAGALAGGVLAYGDRCPRWGRAAAGIPCSVFLCMLVQKTGLGHRRELSNPPPGMTAESVSVSIPEKTGLRLIRANTGPILQLPFRLHGVPAGLVTNAAQMRKLVLHHPAGDIALTKMGSVLGDKDWRPGFAELLTSFIPLDQRAKEMLKAGKCSVSGLIKMQLFKSLEVTLPLQEGQSMEFGDCKWSVLYTPDVARMYTVPSIRREIFVTECADQGEQQWLVPGYVGRWAYLMDGGKMTLFTKGMVPVGATVLITSSQLWLGVGREYAELALGSLTKEPQAPLPPGPLEARGSALVLAGVLEVPFRVVIPPLDEGK